MCATVSWGAHESFMHPIFVLKNGCDTLRVAIIQSNWEQQVAVATYLASMVDWVMLDCLREDQNTREDPRN
jgi:hypothetical protein